MKTFIILLISIVLLFAIGCSAPQVRKGGGIPEDYLPPNQQKNKDSNQKQDEKDKEGELGLRNDSSGNRFEDMQKRLNPEKTVSFSDNNPQLFIKTLESNGEKIRYSTNKPVIQQSFSGLVFLDIETIQKGTGNIEYFLIVTFYSLNKMNTASTNLLITTDSGFLNLKSRDNSTTVKLKPIKDSLSKFKKVSVSFPITKSQFIQLANSSDVTISIDKGSLKFIGKLPGHNLYIFKSILNSPS
ncbi:hypothetical protein KAU33_08540 [Candidatus Dependentiae bacterium]|nr:hypothetical protein [Candidatus Dependentiae bacterium]